MKTISLTKTTIIIVAAIALTGLVFQLTTFAQTIAQPATSATSTASSATSSIVLTGTSTPSTASPPTSSPVLPPSMGTEVTVPWISSVLPFRPSSVAKMGSDYIVIANDYATGRLLRINASSTVTKIASFNSYAIYDLAVAGTNFIITTGDGDL